MTVTEEGTDTPPYGSASFEDTVDNVAPTITNISGPSQALVGRNVFFAGSATDPSSVDTEADFSWQWSVDGDPYSSGSNPFSTSFSTCGDNHTVSAKAEDKDGEVSAPATSTVVSVYEGHRQPPLNEGAYNRVQKGAVLPVKISINECGGGALAGLAPAIQLLKGAKTDGTETTSDEIDTLSPSAADTTGIMRPIEGGYIYNLHVPTKYTDGTDVKSGDLLTIRVRPFSGSPGTDMRIVLEIK